MPALYGALAVKAAAAADPRTRGQPRHLEDVGFLLSIVPDPRGLRDELTSDDLAMLRALAPRLEDNASAAWAHLDTSARLVAQAALGFLQPPPAPGVLPMRGRPRRFAPCATPPGETPVGGGRFERWGPKPSDSHTGQSVR